MKGGAHGSHYYLLTIPNLKGGGKKTICIWMKAGTEETALKNGHIELLILYYSE
jgi:hypothetical protein